MLITGKVTVYLGKRDFIDHLESIDPIDGIVVVENDYLQGRKVYGQVKNKNSIQDYIYIPIIHYMKRILLLYSLGNNNFSLWTGGR